jgi:hypothetical protein
MYQSQFLGSSIALESFSITAKILASQTLQPIAARRQPDWKSLCTSTFHSPILFLAIIKVSPTQAPFFIHG